MIGMRRALLKFRALSLGSALGLAVIASGCDGNAQLKGGPGAGAVHTPSNEESARRPLPPPGPAAGAKSLLEDYVDRIVPSVGESRAWTSVKAKRAVVSALMLVAQDRRLRTPQEAEDAIQDAWSTQRRKGAIDRNPNNPANRLALPIEFRDIFTKNARWGLPDPRQPQARKIGDGTELFEAYREAAARFPSHAKFTCQPQTPGAENAIARGAESMWCLHRHENQIIAYKLNLEHGSLRIAYLGLFGKEPVVGIRTEDYGIPAPGMIPPKRRAMVDTPGQRRGRPSADIPANRSRPQF